MREFRLDFLYVISLYWFFCLSLHWRGGKTTFKWRWWWEFRSMTQRHRTEKIYSNASTSAAAAIYTHRKSWYTRISHEKWPHWSKTIGKINGGTFGCWLFFFLVGFVFIKTFIQTLKWELIYVSQIYVYTLYTLHMQRSPHFHEHIFLVFVFVFAIERNLQLTVIKS